MEFCDLGSHCSLEECRRQDYLPSLQSFDVHS